MTPDEILRIPVVAAATERLIATTVATADQSNSSARQALAGAVEFAAAADALLDADELDAAELFRSLWSGENSIGRSSSSVWPGAPVSWHWTGPTPLGVQGPDSLAAAILAAVRLAAAR